MTIRDIFPEEDDLSGESRSGYAWLYIFFTWIFIFIGNLTNFCILKGIRMCQKMWES